MDDVLVESPGDISRARVLGDSLLARSRLEALTTLAYVGGRTRRVGLGTSVFLPPLREPVVLAYTLASLDLITGGRYELEVSSPGAERPLRTRADYDRFVGKKVNVRYRVGDSEAVLEGELVAVDDAGVAVQGKRADVHHIPWADIQAARLTVSL